MQFYFNDLYPNMGVVNTNTQTIPEAEDKQALAEVNTYAGKVSKKDKKHFYIIFAVIIALVIFFGAVK